MGCVASFFYVFAAIAPFIAINLLDMNSGEYGVANILPLQASALIALFISMMVAYFGLTLVVPNASTIAISETNDKAHGSAAMSFINMLIPTLIALNLQIFSVKIFLLPQVYSIICALMFGLFQMIKKTNHENW